MTKEDLSRISIGYNWNPDMSFEKFCKQNKNIDISNVEEMWKKIELRYIDFKFEKNENRD
jgi:hypothetical protein